MSIADKIRRLPQTVNFQGVEFDFAIIIESPDELKLSYDVAEADIFSPHYGDVKSYGSWHNPFESDSFQGFLWLREGIENDDDLEEALCDVYNFLKKNDFIK
jgi:hypothetical protein